MRVGTYITIIEALFWLGELLVMAPTVSFKSYKTLLPSKAARHSTAELLIFVSTQVLPMLISTEKIFCHCRIRDVENLKQELSALKQRKTPQAATVEDLQEVSLFF